MKEKNNYDGEEQPLNEKQKINLDKTTIISMDNRSDNDVEYKLPKKQKLEFDFDFHDSTIKIADKEQNILKINKEYMESKLWYWKLDNRFKFNLPTTAFNEKKIIDGNKGYQHKNSGQKYKNPSIVGNRFSRQILGEIWINGEFSIESNEPDFPYVWHITECMIKGYEKVKESYFNILSIAFMFLYTLKFRFVSETYYYLCGFSFMSAFYHLYNSIVLIIDLLFGATKYDYDAFSAKKEIMSQRLTNFIINNNNFDFGFFNELSKKELKSIDEKFESKWIHEIHPSLIGKIANNTNKEIMNIIRTKKLEEYLNFLEQDEEFIKFEKAHPSSKDYLLSQQAINEKSYYINFEKNNKMENYESELKTSYIRYLCDFWRQDKIRSFQNELEKETKERIQAEVKNEIKDKKDPLTVYDFNTKNENEINDLVKQYARKKKIPKYRFFLSRTLFNYNKVEYINSSGLTVYKLEKEELYEINSTYCFWRVIYFVLKYFYDVVNFNIFIFRLMINSMFGIKALFFIDLYRDYEINPSTGVIEEAYITITFPRTLRNLWKTVQHARDEFENAPDTGILGKGCMRLFHLFFYYFIILFLFGLLIIIFYPIIIILNIILCTILILSSPALIAIWIVLDYVFTILIYNRFDKDLYITPIIFIILTEFSFGFIFQLIAVFFVIFAQPIISLVVFIFAHIYFIIRIFFNCIFISIFACFGRIPQSDSCVAWQISGPGIFVQRYYDISNKDIICLVRGYLERIIVDNYRKKIEKMLESPIKQIDEIQQTFGLLGFDFVFTEKFEESINFYKKKLKRQIEERNNYYPECNLDVKFTEERLELVKYMISTYISEFSISYNLSNELNKYKKIDDFVEEILKSIFGYRILIPLEKAEKLTHIKSLFDNEMDVIAIKIFENPYFQDKVVVEEYKDEESNKTNKELGGPKTASFEQIYKGDLNLEFFPLSEIEREQILNRSDNVIIQFKN